MLEKATHAREGALAEAFAATRGSLRAFAELGQGRVGCRDSHPAGELQHFGGDEIPSDEAGARRWERIDSLSPRYSGLAITLRWGCVGYRFGFSDDGSAALTNEVSLALDGYERAQLEERVKKATGLEL